MRLTSIKRPVTECGKPVIKIEAQSECLDSIAYDYYGVPSSILQGSSEVVPFRFRKVTNIRGFVRDAPRTIERMVSQNCRTQKVRSAAATQIQGGDMYPAWKMREIEEMFHQKQIIIDGLEVIWRGGELFSALGTCINYFRLQTAVEECPKQQIFGCSTECANNTMYFIIPDRIVNQHFFNDAGMPIANSYNTLLAYYAAQPGVIEATDIPGDLQIRCEYFKVFKVVSNGYIPSVFYFDQYNNSNKVTGMFLDSDNPDYSKLCRGIDNSGCGRVSILPITLTEILCVELELGEPILTETGLCMVIPFAPDWVQHTGNTELIASGNTRALDLSVINDGLISTGGEDVDLEWAYNVGDEPDLCIYDTTVPSGATVNEVQVNGVPVSGSDYTLVSGVLTFLVSCPFPGDTILVKYTYATSTTVMLSGQVIAQITGDGCKPSGNLYFTNTNFSSIPPGSTLLIQSNGDIRWYGPVTSSGPDGSVVEVTNIIYNV